MSILQQIQKLQAQYPDLGWGLTLRGSEFILAPILYKGVPIEFLNLILRPIKAMENQRPTTLDGHVHDWERALQLAEPLLQVASAESWGFADYCRVRIIRDVATFSFPHGYMVHKNVEISNLRTVTIDGMGELKARWILLEEGDEEDDEDDDETNGTSIQEMSEFISAHPELTWNMNWDDTYYEISITHYKNVTIRFLEDILSPFQELDGDSYMEDSLDEQLQEWERAFQIAQPLLEFSPECNWMGRDDVHENGQTYNVAVFEYPHGYKVVEVVWEKDRAKVPGRRAFDPRWIHNGKLSL